MENNKPIKLVRVSTLETFEMIDVAEKILKRKILRPIIKLVGNCKRCGTYNVLFQKFLCADCLNEDFKKLRHLQDRGLLFEYNKEKKNARLQ